MSMAESAMSQPTVTGQWRRRPSPSIARLGPVAVASFIFLTATIQIYKYHQQLFVLAPVRQLLNATPERQEVAVAETPQQERKPVLILHSGPPKTGSTTLQCSLERLRPQLEADNYAYIGRPECDPNEVKIHNKHRTEFRLFSKALVDGFECHAELNAMRNINTTTTVTIPSCWKEFTDRLETYRQSHTNVVFSDEAFANRVCRTSDYDRGVPYPWEALQRLLLFQQDWDVRILIMNRPLHDWMASVYNDNNKEAPGKRKLRLWPTMEGACPRQNGRAVPLPMAKPTGRAKIDLTIHALLQPQQTFFPTTQMSVQAFERHGFARNIRLLEMKRPSKSDQDLVTRVVCEEFPGAHQTCAALRKQPLLSQQNPSRPLHYDWLGVEACRRGMVDGNVNSRQYVRDAIRNRQEVELQLTADDFPLDCPNDRQLQEVWRVSLEHERAIKLPLPIDEDAYRNSFDKAVAQHKFCTVDAAKVLEDKDWVDFFRSLKEK